MNNGHMTSNVVQTGVGTGGSADTAPVDLMGCPTVAVVPNFSIDAEEWKKRFRSM